MGRSGGKFTREEIKIYHDKENHKNFHDFENFALAMSATLKPIVMIYGISTLLRANIGSEERVDAWSIFKADDSWSVKWARRVNRKKERNKLGGENWEGIKVS